MWLRNLPGAPPATAVTPGGGSSGFTAGSVIFADSAGALNQDNAAFFWDATNDRLGIGLAAPLSPLHVAGTISPAVAANGYVARFGGTLVEAGSGAHAVMAGAAFLAPTLTTAGGATTTTLANAYVAANPTGGTTNFGLFADGTIGLANTVALQGKTTGGAVVALIAVSGGNFIDIGAAAGINGTRIYGTGLVSFPDANVYMVGDVEIDGALNHDGTTVGFYGKAPVVRAAAPTAPAGGATVDAESRTAINQIIALLGAATGVGLSA